MSRAVSKLLLFLPILVGCNTYDLGPEWSPLSVVIERPILPFASDSATTTIGAHVYTTNLSQWLRDYPPGSIEFHALLMHEREHARRQFDYKNLPGELAKAAWITRYLSDKKFRWEEEQAGHYQSITYLNKNGRWSWDRTEAVAASMANSYNGMISFEEARAWILDVLSGIWNPGAGD